MAVLSLVCENAACSPATQRFDDLRRVNTTRDMSLARLGMIRQELIQVGRLLVHTPHVPTGVTTGSWREGYRCVACGHERSF